MLFRVIVGGLLYGLSSMVVLMKGVLLACLDFHRTFLIRRCKHCMEKFDHRRDVLEGLMFCFLNLDRVNDIFRYDDAPKAALMREDWGQKFTRATDETDYVSPGPGGEGDGLTEIQTEAILNMRLRSLRRLEEMELLKERDKLMEERAGLEDLLEEESLQWSAIADQLKDVKKTFGKDYEGGARRTLIKEAAEVEEVPLEAMIDKEPITVVCSKMGWIRAMSGHIDLDQIGRASCRERV